MKGKRFPCLRDQGIKELAEGLRVLSDVNRLRIICLLLGGERCVCEVVRELGISQQLASHHLNVLKEAGFLRSRKEGSSCYYSVVPDRLERIVVTLERYLKPSGLGKGECEDRSCLGNSFAGHMAGTCRFPGGLAAGGIEEVRASCVRGGRRKR